MRDVLMKYKLRSKRKLGNRTCILIIRYLEGKRELFFGWKNLKTYKAKWHNYNSNYIVVMLFFLTELQFNQVKSES